VIDPRDADVIGVIGAGRLGTAMARLALRAGRRVVIANSRGPETLASVVLALVHEAVENVTWDGEVLVDATNDWSADDLQGRTSTELVADLVTGARVVKAGNTLGADVLGSDPLEAGGRRVIFLSGDDHDAKEEVAALFQAAGFAVIDLGGLATGGAMQQIHHPLAGVNLIQL
jgi:predicted dinucleotide-binding enzyme